MSQPPKVFLLPPLTKGRADGKNWELFCQDEFQKTERSFLGTGWAACLACWGLGKAVVNPITVRGIYVFKNINLCILER